MTGLRAAVLAGVAALCSAAPAGAAVPVGIQFQAFSPTPVDVLPGETVEWMNMSERPHTVTADDESFDSEEIYGGDRFEVTYDSVGSFPYHCRLHLGMTGEVDVRRVTLGPLPTELVPVGERVQVEGRTADPASPVRIERSTGGPFETVATATPGPDGTWETSVVAERTAQYRAASGPDASQERRLIVSDRRVIVRVRPGKVSVRVVPPTPYGRVTLDLRLRERFGWWPAQRKRLDYLSRASFRVNRRVRGRVALVDRDGWTPLARSPVVRLRPERRGRDSNPRESD